jgi:hypothetical protein
MTREPQPQMGYQGASINKSTMEGAIVVTQMTFVAVISGPGDDPCSRNRVSGFLNREITFRMKGSGATRDSYSMIKPPF